MKPKTRVLVEVGASLVGVLVLVGGTIALLSKPATASPTPTAPGAPGSPPSANPPVGGSRPPAPAPKPYMFQQGERYQLTFTLPAGTVRGAQIVGNALQQVFSSNFSSVNGVTSSGGSSFVTTIDWTGATQTPDLAGSFPGMTVTAVDMGQSPGPVTTTVTLIPGAQRQIVFPGTTLTMAAPAGGNISLRHLSGAQSSTAINAPTDTLPTFTAVGETLVYTYAWADASGAGQNTTLTVVVS